MSIFQPGGRRKEERGPLPFKDTSWKLVAHYTLLCIPLARTVAIWAHLDAKEDGKLFQAAFAQLKFTSAVTERRGHCQLHEGRGGVCLIPVPGTMPGTQQTFNKCMLNECMERGSTGIYYVLGTA